MHVLFHRSARHDFFVDLARVVARATHDSSSWFVLTSLDTRVTWAGAVNHEHMHDVDLIKP
jgi:hypothetical protein